MKMMDGEELLRFVWGQEFVEDSLVDVRRWFVTCYTHTHTDTHTHTHTHTHRDTHTHTDRQTDTHSS